MQRKRTRGRPRIYPRLDDVLRYKKSLEANGIEESTDEFLLNKSQNQIEFPNSLHVDNELGISKSSKLRQLLTNSKETFKDEISIDKMK